MFTTQGACEPRAEAILSQVADAIAKVQESDVGEVKADMLQSINLCIARSVVRSILRRRNHPKRCGESRASRIYSELAMPDEDEFE